MSGRKSRSKGARFEREVARAIREALGVELKRELDQYQERGLGDLRGWDGVLVECKRYADATTGQVDAWWDETIAEADAAKRAPVLIYRLDRKPVRVRLALGDIMPSFFGTAEHNSPIEVDFDTFVAIARERYLGHVAVA